VVIGGYRWLYVVVCGYMLHLVICGNRWLYVVIGGYMECVYVICGYM
jgi:hypothetical protein